MSEGKTCSCGSSYGLNGPGTCDIPCNNTKVSQICGGKDSYVVYTTKVKGIRCNFFFHYEVYAEMMYELCISVPGPPQNLSITQVTTNSLALSWEKPMETSKRFITNYYVSVKLIKSFDLSGVSIL